MLGYRELPGGQIATAMLACARLGLRTAFVGASATTRAAERVLAPLRAAGVDVSRVRACRARDAQLAVIVVDAASGERTVLGTAIRGSRRRARSSRALAVERARLLQLDAGDLEAALSPRERGARARACPVVLDVDTAAPGARGAARARSDFPIVSRGFAEALRAARAAAPRSRGCAALGARLPVVTLGEQRRARARGRARCSRAPPSRVEVRDTTGAGDVFHAAFALAAARGPRRRRAAAHRERARRR